jgi:hypothetical protein
MPGRRKVVVNEVGAFDTVTAAARRIREIEGRPSGGIFLEMYCQADLTCGVEPLPGMRLVVDINVAFSARLMMRDYSGD